MIFETAESILNELTFGGGGAEIKSIQRGTTTIVSADTSVYVTISAVDLSCSFVQITYGSGSTSPNTPMDLFTSAWFTNSTTFTIQRPRFNGGDVLVQWEVVEFQPGVSIQQLVVAMNVASMTSTITSVDTTRAYLITSSLIETSTNTTAAIGDFMPRIVFTDSTTLQLTRKTTVSLYTYVVIFIVEVQ